MLLYRQKFDKEMAQLHSSALCSAELACSSARSSSAPHAPRSSKLPRQGNVIRQATPNKTRPLTYISVHDDPSTNFNLVKHMSSLFPNSTIGFLVQATPKRQLTPSTTKGSAASNRSFNSIRESPKLSPTVRKIGKR